MPAVETGDLHLLAPEETGQQTDWPHRNSSDGGLAEAEPLLATGDLFTAALGTSDPAGRGATPP